MFTHAIPRLLLAGCLIAVFATGAVISNAAANTETTDWSDTVSGEDEFVQACNGFDMTTSYASNRAFHVIENYAGDWVVERLKISFAGSLANATNGYSLPYDGKLTRITYDYIGRVVVSDLELRIGLLTPGDFTLKIARLDMDLASNPVEVIHVFAQRELKAELCVLLDRAFVGSMPRTTQDFARDVRAKALENDAYASGAMTPWTERDLCDTSPPGQNCS